VVSLQSDKIDAVISDLNYAKIISDLVNNRDNYLNLISFLSLDRAMELALRLVKEDRTNLPTTRRDNFPNMLAFLAVPTTIADDLRTYHRDCRNYNQHNTASLGDQPRPEKIQKYYDKIVDCFVFLFAIPKDRIEEDYNRNWSSLIELLLGKLSHQTSERKYFDEKLKAYYENNREELHSFLNGIYDTLKCIKNLENVNLDYKFQEFEKFIFGLEDFAKEGAVKFYPEAVFSNFRHTKQLALKVKEKFDALTNQISAFKRETVNETKLDIDNWAAWFSDILIVKVRAELKFLPAQNNFDDLTRKDEMYSKVYSKLRYKIDDFLFKLMISFSFNSKFIATLTELHSNLTEIEIEYKDFLKSRNVLSITEKELKKKFTPI